jgi:3-isopropylmalate/(R)-2-methylmalate dehydratase small subunit
MTAPAPITRVAGRAVVLSGHDIDTDRIMPARFLKAVTFDGLEAHLFADDRAEARAAGRLHPFDDPSRLGAAVLFVHANFGCGSSREHAPQALRRRGIQAIVGESFGEIFRANALTLGLPCVTADAAGLERLMAAAGDPLAEFAVDIAAGRVEAPGLTVPVELPAEARLALLSGDWDAVSRLVEGAAGLEALTARWPYLSGFSDR